MRLQFFPREHWKSIRPYGHFERVEEVDLWARDLHLNTINLAFPAVWDPATYLDSARDESGRVARLEHTEEWQWGSHTLTRLWYWFSGYNRPYRYGKDAWRNCRTYSLIVFN